MPSGMMKRFGGGDPAAVRELYGSYAKAVFTVAFSSLRDHGLAEEAVQQTFLQAWRAADSFDGDRDPGPWLYAIARRVAVDLYRRERRHQRRQTLDANTDVAAMPESFEQTWEAWEIRLALDKMPEDQRDIIAATHFLGLAHEQTAHKLGLPFGTVKSRSHPCPPAPRGTAFPPRGGNSMRCDDARAAYLAGEPSRAHTDHLSSCRECLSITGDLETTLRVLEQDAVWEDPDANLEDRVVNLIAGTVPVRRKKGPRVPWLVAAAVTVVLLIGGGLWVTQRPADPDWEVALPGTSEAPAAADVVSGWNEDTGTRLAFAITGLDNAPAGSVYEVWFSRDAVHVSAGTFAAGGEIDMSTGISRKDFPRIWITLEPIDLDEGPSGHTVMDSG